MPRNSSAETVARHDDVPPINEGGDGRIPFVTNRVIILSGSLMHISAGVIPVAAGNLRKFPVHAQPISWRSKRPSHLGRWTALEKVSTNGDEPR